MLSSEEFEESQRQNMAGRRAMITRWAEYVRTHDDVEWSRQQNTLVNSQLRTANALATSGDTDPVRFANARDRLRKRE